MGHACSHPHVLLPTDDLADLHFEAVRFDTLAENKAYKTGEIDAEFFARQVGRSLREEERLERSGTSVSVCSSSIQSLLKETRVLDAEAALLRTARQLQQRKASYQLENLFKDPMISNLMTLTAEYYRAGNTLDESRSVLKGKADDWQLIWEVTNARVFMKAVENTSLVKLRMFADLEASLSECLLSLNEEDLKMSLSTSLASAQVLGSETTFGKIAHSVHNFVVYNIETLVEVTRIPNKEYGMLVEVIRSNFPTEVEVPPGSWLSSRVDVNATNLWIPKGSDKRGTILIQESLVDVGLAGESILKMVLDIGMTDTLKKFSDMPKLVKTSTTWSERLRNDRTGLYSVLQNIEKVASLRTSEVSLENLPCGEEVMGTESNQAAINAILQEVSLTH
eukprot:TRINITY_DN27142_c0_g1_i1.p1 TRINITY_DN27142_c0_g1~~TRINITY_DN27142_c0_g1_i1.p1  ORF type:complete len:394 (-),score=42.94 TRINITY_DN27142_c0_g1_i1:65-1246(-)